MLRCCTVLILLVIGFNACKEQKKEMADNNGVYTDATYYFIRHADKDRSPGVGDDPELTEKGEARAAFWAKTLSDVDFDAVYSTDYNRTRSTALPTAKQNDVPVSIYDPQQLFSASFEQETAGKTVLVVGHSNTTPAFVNTILGEEKFEEINDSVFGNLYIVRIKNGHATAELKDYNDWSFN